MRISLLFAAAAVACALTIAYGQSAAGQGADGNPHNWDRKRRCDHTDYSPACGVCEGYGGIPTGDDNDQITLTTCTPAEQPTDHSKLIKPVWSSKWFAKDYQEIIIGAVRDPFCFQVFPGNTSEGKLCYRHDSGTQSYDMEGGEAGPHTLYEDLDLDTKVGSVESKVIHQGQSFWVVNHFPWYALGIHQCICTEAHEGADPSQPGVYPVQYNWTQQMFYIGREIIGVEYGVGNMTLDHWAFGPHHVWSVPETGKAYRMWQPFNGLQVFQNGTDSVEGLDMKVFEDIPPALCKKGGATFRIKCTDDGLPQNSTSLAAHKEKLRTMPKDTSTDSDMARAIQVVPGSEFKGETFTNMSLTLNKYLAATAAVKPCDEFEAKELQELSAMLYLARDSKLDKVYSGIQDNRRLRADLEDLQATWTKLNNEVLAHPDKENLHKIQRDGHCHEAVMWYVHHLSTDVKMVLAETGVEVPLLSYESHNPTCAEATDGTHKKVCNHYQETVLCSSCHSNALPSNAF